MLKLKIKQYTDTLKSKNMKFRNVKPEIILLKLRKSFQKFLPQIEQRTILNLDEHT